MTKYKKNLKGQITPKAEHSSKHDEKYHTTGGNSTIASSYGHQV